MINLQASRKHDFTRSSLMESLGYIDLIDPITVVIPEAARRSRWLGIDITIKARDYSIGTVDLSKTYPKIFSGYVYTLINNAIIDCVPLHWERQRIWDVELDRPHDMLLSGLVEQIDYLNAIDGNLNPFDEPTGLYATGYEKFLSGIGELGDCNRVKAHRIGAISIWIPVGVTYDINIQWEPWCDLLTDLDNDGNLELSETSGRVIPELINSVLNNNPLINATFDEVARYNGYIPLSEYGDLVKINYKIVFNVNPSTGGGVGGVRAVTVNTPTAPSVSIQVFNPSTSAPTGTYLVALTSSTGCTPSTTVTPTRSNGTQWVVATITTLTGTFYSLLYGTSVLSANPTATITSNLRCN